MTLPYGMIAGPGMDPRALNAGNLLYTYGNPVMSFPNYAAGYGQDPRVKNGEETTAPNKTSTASTHLRHTELASRSSKEPLRTESVIKTVTDKQDNARKRSDLDKRNATDAQGSNMLVRYPDNDTGSELGKSVDGKKVLPLRDSSLRDAQLREHSLRDAQRTEDVSRYVKQSMVNDIDWVREKPSKSKTFAYIADSSGIKRPTNGLSSRTTENGTFFSHDKSFISSEARSSPYPANEPPTLVPYHNSLPPRSSSSSTHSNVPSTMPKLTPIAPRISNGSPLTLSYSSDIEHRRSPSFGAKRQNYGNSTNSVSSAPSVMGYSGVMPWTANGPGKPLQGEKTEDNWRTKQYPREERDLNRTSGHDSASKVHVSRNFIPPPWERLPHYGPLASHLHAVGADKGFSGKDAEDADSRDLSRDTSREGIKSSEQSQVKTVATSKFGTVPVNLRKESDLAGTKISSSVRQEDFQRNQPFVGRNEKSVVGEYVNYNKNKDTKGSLGNVIIHKKECSVRLSVDRREGGQKYPKPEIPRPSRAEYNRSVGNSYSNYNVREQGVSHAELKSARDDKGKEDRARIVESPRSREQALYQEHSGRKSDSRDLSSASDGRKNNDRNNNSTSLDDFPFYKQLPSGFPSAANGEHMRFVERGAASDSKVSIPPNVTLDRYEKREQEVEKNGFKRIEINSFPRNVEGSHSFNTNDDGSKRNEERRSLPRRDEGKSKVLTGRFENNKRSVDAEEISSDENDEGHRRITRETVSPDKRAQLRVAQSSDRTTASPAAGAARQRRLSSPLSEQRSSTADKRHITASNAFGAPFGTSLQSRRIPSDASDSHSRDSNIESRMEELGNSGAAQFIRMDGGAFPPPYFGQLLPTSQGLSEAPLLLLDPASFYGAMYRPHMMEAASQGIFPPGGFAASDPMTGQIMMIPPEAYIPMVAAENAFMNPMMDPRFAAMWGMPGAVDEAQWQQFYQMMQPAFQQQHKQFLEQSKQEFLMGKQGVPFPLASYPFFFGDKHHEQKRKEEMQDVTSTEQKQKSREIQQESSESQPKETVTRPKPEPITPQERLQHVPAAPRDSEIVEKKETSNQREDKSVIDSRRMKEVHQKLTEKQNLVQAKLDAQGQMAKQIKEYLSLDPLSQFPFTGPQASFLRDRSSANLTAPATTTSAGTPEVDRNSVSPKTVSAAVTLSSLEKSRAQETNSAGRASPLSSNDTCVSSAQNSVIDRAKSPRLRPGFESTVSNEIVEKPQRLEAQPSLASERIGSRESRDLRPEQVPLQFPHNLMAFGSIASEQLLKEKTKQESERERFERPFWGYNRGLPLNFDEMLRGGTEKSLVENFERQLLGKENSKRTESYGDILTSLIKSEIERSEKGLQPVQIGLRESVESHVDSRENLQTLDSSEKLSPAEHLDGHSDYEDDFSTKCELRRIASSFVPLEPDVENKENSTIFSLRPFKSEAERKQIRDNIDRLRLMAKRRNSEDRFTVFSRRRDVRSPTTILNSVTSAISDVARVEAVEKEMRMKLAELQKRYREKVRELARLQPKYSIDDGNSKSTPIKRGPGRPRKRKYFGASSKGDKHSPVPTADENKEGDESPPASGTQTPEPNAAASESENLVVKDSEPPKKKKKKTKQSNPVEQERRATATPILGMSPVELTDTQVLSAKKKKSRKPSVVEEESSIAIPKSKTHPEVKKKNTAGTGKRRKGSPTEGTLNEQVTTPQLPAVPEISAKDVETDVTEPEVSSKNTKTKKLKPKKRARPKLTIDNPDSYEGKMDDELPLDNAVASCETPQASTSTKSKKAKGAKKKRRSTSNTPPKGKFEFPDVTSQDESFSENSSVSPNEIAKEIVAMAAKQMEAQKKSMQMQSDNDDDVFTSGHDSRDGLSLLAQASFETVDKSSRRKRSVDNPALSEDLLQKKRGRPKKETESPLSEQDSFVSPKKKKKKKVLDENITNVPKKKKKKKKKKVVSQNEEITQEKPAEVHQEERPQLPSYQQQDKQETEQPDAAMMNEDSEPEEDVFRPADEIGKDARGGHPSACISREGDDFKGIVSSLLGDEWQPRRSERIFINSSVTTNSSSSPLSPTTKGSEFSYAKKTKKGPTVKAKMARSDSQVEEELEESDVVMPQKVKAKAKKKRGTGKGKKKISSDEDYEPGIKVSRRVRSKSRQLIDFDDADEEEADDIQEDEQPREEGEIDVEINETDKMDTTLRRAEEQGGQQAVDAEGGRDAKPEVEEQEKEAKVQDEEENSKMDMDETLEDRSDSTEIMKADATEESAVKESIEETCREEKTDEASCEQPLSPGDVRFTFLIEELQEGSKLLLPVESVFFPGRISTFNEPDLFGVVLDGERGRRPHWKSTQQLLNQAVKDIQPPSAKFLPIGTRVCAHWSPQYRCFYPGTVTEAPPDEKEVEGKIWIEFDDGDSGFFQLNEIKRIHPDFPVEDVESTPSLPEKRPRSNSLGTSQPTAIKDFSSRLRAEETTSEFSSGNESSGEFQAKRRRLRGNRKSKDDSWLVSKQTDSDSKESNANKGEMLRSKKKEAEKHGIENTESLTKLKDKIHGSNESQEIKVSDAQPKQKSSKSRGKIEVEAKETTKIAESIKRNLPSNASAELKESEKKIHLSDSSFKTGGYENSCKQSSDKVGVVVGNSTESSDQGEDSDANSDAETAKQDKGPRGSTRGSSRTTEKDLRRRSLTLSLTGSFRSSRTEGESPTRDVLSASQDEDSESYSDTFDESPMVENKPFQPRLGRRRRSELDRLQVDMKYSGPLWQWSGKNFQNKRKGKGKKVFYKAIVRGDETISVGDCAVFMSNPTKNLNLPYVGRIESMWEGCGGNMVVKVKWFYHPEETKPGRKPSDGKQSLYRSTHVDENDVQTISHKCEVLTPEEFKQRLQSLESPSTRTSLSDRVFCCIGSYDPNNETLQTEL